jgi:hypothetical protein
MSDLDDEHPEKKLASLEGVKERVRAMMKQLGTGKDFDFLFTHGASGEYGHNRHREAHRAVVEMLASGELSAHKVFFFNYRRSRSGDYCVADTRGTGEELHEGGAKACGNSAVAHGAAEEVHCARASTRNGAAAAGNGHASARNCGADARSARVTTRLSARTARAKHLLITSAYQFSRGSFEARSARAIESFKVDEHAINGTLPVPAGTGRHQHPGRNALPRPAQEQS